MGVGKNINLIHLWVILCTIVPSVNKSISFRAEPTTQVNPTCSI